MYIADEFFPDKENKAALNAPPLTGDEIIYEDDNIIIVDKKQGETVHSSYPDENPEKKQGYFLIDRICSYLIQTGAYSPEDENSFAPALCNRLDRNTCGLIVAAKNAAALRIMNQKIKDRELKKEYLCVVHGVPQKKSDTLNGFLYKNKALNKVFVYDTFKQAKALSKTRYNDDIKTIITKYTTLKSKANTALLKVELVTGRTHQIRAHLAHIGHPLVGDGKYGISHSQKNYQSLCSYYLTFSFRTDAGILSYLDGRTFQSKGAAFIDEFYS